MTVIHERRRRAIMDLMGEGIAIIPTAPESQRNSDVHYAFSRTSSGGGFDPGTRGG